MPRVAARQSQPRDEESLRQSNIQVLDRSRIGRNCHSDESFWKQRVERGTPLKLA